MDGSEGCGCPMGSCRPVGRPSSASILITACIHTSFRIRRNHHRACSGSLSRRARGIVSAEHSARISGDPQDTTERLKQFIVTNSIALEYDDRIRPAHGLSSGGKITILPGLSSAQEFSVLVHETAHELLHRGERRAQTNHIIRETEAEAVAFVVSTAIGLDPGTSSSDYIQLHSGDKATLAESLGCVQRTAADILKAILPQDPVAKLQADCDSFTQPIAASAEGNSTPERKA